MNGRHVSREHSEAQPASAPGKLAKGGRIALAVNPSAGLGATRNIEIARRVIQALAPGSVITGAGALGGDAAVNPLIVHMPTDPGNPTSRIASEAARANVDLLVVVGGDGTLADAALALHNLASSVPILGVGAGSTNAGALISLLPEATPDLAAYELQSTPVNALGVVCPNGDTALAFNDVVVATTVCGTVDGEFVNLDAAAFMRGHRVTGVPGLVSSSTARVTKVTAADELEVAAGAEVGSVVIGFSNTGDLRGQALLGGLGLSAGAAVPAGCLVATAPLVYAGFDAARHADIEPLRSSYVGLQGGEAIRLSGFAAGAILCADGNPLWAMKSADIAEIRLIQDACRTVRLVGGTDK